MVWREQIWGSRRLTAMKWLVFIAAMMQGYAAFAQPARILLIRHGEKPTNPDNPHLTPAGRDRANRWMAYFTNATDQIPDFLFAPRPSEKRPSVRAIETLEPLAHHLGKPIETPFGAGDYAKLADQLLTDPRYKGKTIAICWVHQVLPQFASALGVDPEPDPWESNVFDRVYLLTFENGKARLTIKRSAGRSGAQS
jgi:hypothetical protein